MAVLKWSAFLLSTSTSQVRVLLRPLKFFITSPFHIQLDVWKARPLIHVLHTFLGGDCQKHNSLPLGPIQPSCPWPCFSTGRLESGPTTTLALKRGKQTSWTNLIKWMVSIVSRGFKLIQKQQLRVKKAIECSIVEWSDAIDLQLWRRRWT